VTASLVREPYAGVFPIAPTPFTAGFDLDLDGQRRVLDCMIDQGVDGICILANYSEQFLLTDAERDTLLRVCLEHVAGRVPVIVTCSHFSTQIAVERDKVRLAGHRPTLSAAEEEIKGLSLNLASRRTCSTIVAVSFEMRFSVR